MRPRPAPPALARVVPLLALALPLALAGCGGDDTIAPGDVPAGEAPPAATPDAELSASPSVTVPPAGDGDEPAAASTTSPAGRTGPVAVSDLEPGMCFEDVGTGLNEVTEVPVVPCDAPHSNEVFALLEQPGDTFPGEEEIRGLADEGCHASFEEYVGAPFETSTLTSFPVTPTAESWAQGDRQVVCVLTSPQPRTSSARGSGA